MPSDSGIERVNGRGSPADRARVHQRREAGNRSPRRCANLLARVAGGMPASCPSCGQHLAAPALRLELVGFADDMELLVVNPRQNLAKILDDVRRAVVEHALREAGGIQKEAAQLVGMKYSTFHDLVQRLGLGDG